MKKHPIVTDSYLNIEEKRTDFIHDFEPAWYAPILLTLTWTEEG